MKDDGQRKMLQFNFAEKEIKYFKKRGNAAIIIHFDDIKQHDIVSFDFTKNLDIEKVQI